MIKNLSALLIGLIFIFAGMGLLLNRLEIIDFGWSQIYPILFLLLSLVSFISSIKGQRNSAFWAGIFLVLGLFFLLRNFDIIPYFWFDEFWPIFLIALGVGFIFLYIFKPSDWGVLIPGFILTLLGVLFIFETMDILHDVFDLVLTYWPLILVIIGGILIAGSIRKRDIGVEERSDTEVQEEGDS